MSELGTLPKSFSIEVIAVMSGSNVAGFIMIASKLLVSISACSFLLLNKPLFLILRVNLVFRKIQLALYFFQDPLGEVRKLYDFLGMNLTPEAESAMISYLKNDPKKKVYGKHVYKKGVHFSRQFIEEEFKEYINLMSKRVNRKDIV